MKNTFVLLETYHSYSDLFAGGEKAANSEENVWNPLFSILLDAFKTGYQVFLTLGIVGLLISGSLLASKFIFVHKGNDRQEAKEHGNVLLICAFIVSSLLTIISCAEAIGRGISI